MKKTFFASQHIKRGESDNDYEFTLEYYLVSNSIRDYEYNEYKDCFGIEIIKKYTDISGNELSQKSTAKNLTTDKKSAYGLLRSVYNQKITPACLLEVIDDNYEEFIVNKIRA